MNIREVVQPSDQLDLRGDVGEREREMNRAFNLSNPLKQAHLYYF